MTLQTASIFSSPDTPITAEQIYDISGSIPHHVIKHVFDVCAKQSFGDVQFCMHDLVCEGYDVLQILVQLLEEVSFKHGEELSDIQKARFAQYAAETQFRLLQGMECGFLRF